jgi:hypothetical protein
MMNTDLLPRPFSCDRPRVEGYEPLIKSRITRIGRSRRNSWRSEILIDDCAMSMSHHNTKAEAETSAAEMLRAYAKVHYTQV